MDAGFAYEATTNVIAAAAIFNGANAGEVLVAPWSKGAGYSRIIGSQNNASAQLDQNIGGVAIGADGTVYVASTTGYVNVFGPAASGDVAPERRIIGTSTALSSPDALAIYPPQ
jgi:hypothetical protein